jgi:hypothetical protein
VCALSRAALEVVLPKFACGFIASRITASPCDGVSRVVLALRTWGSQEARMKTFVARFIRPSGGVGVIHIMASSSMSAMLSAMRQVSDATGMSVRPVRHAALLVQYPVNASERTEPPRGVER